MEGLGLNSIRPRGNIFYIYEKIHTFWWKNSWNPCNPFYKCNEFTLVHLTQWLEKFKLLFKQYGLMGLELVF